MNQENLNGTIDNINSNVTPVQPNVQPQVAQPVQPSVQPQVVQSVQSSVQPQVVQPVQPNVQPQVAQPVQPSVQPQNNEAINVLNKEDAMEEALSHTNQYTPFEVQQEEVNQETNLMGNKKAIIFLVVLLVIMGLFIIFLPQISKMIGL